MIRTNGDPNPHKRGRQISSATREAISYAIIVQNRVSLSEISNNQYINKVGVMAKEPDVNPHTARDIAVRGVKRARKDSTH